MHDIEMDMEKTTAVIGPSIPASIAAAQADVELDPHDWSSPAKTVQLVPLVFVAAMTAVNVAALGTTGDAGETHFHVTSLQYLLSNTGFFLSLAVGPMFLAPISESYGRRPIFLVTLTIYSLLFVPAALVRQFTAWAVVRALSGLSASVVNTMVSGTITDLYGNRDVGRIMNLYVFSLFAGQSVSPVLLAWMTAYIAYPWIWALQGILTAIGTTCYIVLGKETRLASLMERRSSLKENLVVLKRSVSRPFLFLATEPIVTVLSLWVGFAWGLIFLFMSSVTLVFASYGFSAPECATFEVTVVLGALPAFLVAMFVDRSKNRQRQKGPSTPEQVLPGSCIGAIALPVCMFMFGWTARPSIHWVVPSIALVGVNFGVYCIFHGVFSYLAEAYGPFSSSAQASQSFMRNVLGGTLPLAAHAMFIAMGTSYACTMLGAICALFAAAPFLLIRYGRRLRENSRAARQIARHELQSKDMERIDMGFSTLPDVNADREK